MQAFGVAERGLAQELSDYVSIYYLKLPSAFHEIPYALLGQRRISPLIETIKHIAKITGIDDEYLSEIELAGNQISEVRYLRDLIVHNGVYRDAFLGAKWYCIDNAHNAGGFEKIKTVCFQLDHLKSATADLPWCAYRISAALKPLDDRDRYKSQRAKVMTGEQSQWAINPSERPWRYKPHELHRHKGD